MKKLIFTAVCLLMAILVYPRVFSFVYRYVPSEWWTERVAYGQVRDIYHPKNEDYQALQKFLSKGKRPALTRLDDFQKKMRHFCIIGKTADEIPQCGKIAVNCSEESKENCLLVYASFNKSYPKDLKKLVENVSKSDFRGHILYRLGGWPNKEEGDLKLAHVPNAFKPCFFREAQRLGYQRVFWLDASILPLVSLNRIFETIASKGYFIPGNGQYVGPFMNEQAATSLKTTLDECSKIPSCSAGIFGVDFSNEKAAQAFGRWYLAANDPDAYFSPRAEQNALSIILYQEGLQELAPPDTVVDTGQSVSTTTLFKIDRGFVQYGK